MSTFAEKLMEFREKHGLKAPELAELIDVPYGTYLHWEQDGTIPRPATLRKIAKALDVDESWLLTNKEKDPSKSITTNETKVTKIPFDPKDEPNPTSNTIPLKLQESKPECQPYSRDKGIYYCAEDEQKLRDVNIVISQIKDMNISRANKKRIHKTMSAYRMELECKVFYGADEI